MFFQPMIVLIHQKLMSIKKVCIPSPHYIQNKNWTLIAEKYSLLVFQELSFISTENTIINAMIPKRPDNGCPSGTINGLETCFCEDHCSWKICRLINPPFNCLPKTDDEIAWAWNVTQNAWVSQSKIEWQQYFFPIK